ncbi:hypothetical protein AtNW77_Chr5g0113851 [Arabidopsis thaliana]
MMKPPQGMHMTHARPSEWGGTGYDLSGKSRTERKWVIRKWRL